MYIDVHIQKLQPMMYNDVHIAKNMPNEAWKMLCLGTIQKHSKTLTLLMKF